MGRDALRQLEDEHLRITEAERCGKWLPSIGTVRYILKHLIRMQKEINQLKEKRE